MRPFSWAKLTDAFRFQRYFQRAVVIGGGTTHDVAVAETGSVAESPIAVTDFVGSDSEAGSAVESQAAAAVFVGATSETVAALDSQTSTADFSSITAESGTAIDDSVGLADFVAAVGESIAVAESQIGGLAIAVRTDEVLAIAETSDATVSSGTTFEVAVDESVTAGDIMEATVAVAPADTRAGGGGYPPRIEEYIAPVRRRATFNVHAADTLFVTEIHAGVAAFDGVAPEALVLAASALGDRITQPTIDEILAVLLAEEMLV